jgi:hypothetical protein
MRRDTPYSEKGTAFFNSLLGRTRLSVDDPNGREEGAIGCRPTTFGPIPPGVIACWRDMKSAAHQSDKDSESHVLGSRSISLGCPHEERRRTF